MWKHRTIQLVTVKTMILCYKAIKKFEEIKNALRNQFVYHKATFNLDNPRFIYYTPNFFIKLIVPEMTVFFTILELNPKHVPSPDLSAMHHIRQQFCGNHSTCLFNYRLYHNAYV